MSRRFPPRHRRAFTLLELLVVLVILGASASLALPAFRLPGPPSTEAPIERARGLAIRRGETVRLETTPDGRWQVVGVADSTAAVLASGTALAADAVPGQILVTALGTCLPVGQLALGGGTWDPVRCVLSPR